MASKKRKFFKKNLKTPKLGLFFFAQILYRSNLISYFSRDLLALL